MKRIMIYAWMVLMFCMMTMCQTQKKLSEITFTEVTVSGQANNWWARAMADINGDGLLDIVLQDDNAYGGWLGWLETGQDTARWKLHLIADSARIGDDFACGDMETADLDHDGDVDVFGFVQEGEWESADSSTIYWFENPGWEAHLIGKAPGFIKDVEKADFNNDGKTDIAVITYTRNSLQVFCQDQDGWREEVSQMIPNLHEGMSVGDIDGDGYTDIATNGYWVRNPGGDGSAEWVTLQIDSRWSSQEGDWSKNATKNFCADVDEDGKAEVFISHSERKGYPVSWYDLVDAENNTWEEYVIDTIDGCHTLQVYDFNHDGHLDVLAGENQMRWEDEDDPVNLYLNSGDNQNFIKQTISSKGIYNGLAGDLDQDGDLDILRLPGHSSTTLYIWFNQIK